jgi:hypothetical protein
LFSIDILRFLPLTPFLLRAKGEEETKNNCEGGEDEKDEEPKKRGEEEKRETTRDRERSGHWSVYQRRSQ